MNNYRVPSSVTFNPTNSFNPEESAFLRVKGERILLTLGIRPSKGTTEIELAAAGTESCNGEHHEQQQRRRAGHVRARDT